jgi:hypothetical protein
MISAMQRQSIDMLEGAMLCPQSSGHDLLECSDGERDELVAQQMTILAVQIAVSRILRCALVRRRECRHTVRHS